MIGLYIPRREPEPDVERLTFLYGMLKQNPEYAVSELKVLAEGGSSSAMLHIGSAYQRGIGAVRNMTEAEKWYREAANRGSFLGYLLLGQLYQKLKHYDEALRAFRYVAAAEYGPALDNLGRMYFFGAGVGQDLDKARSYLERAARAGNLKAKLLLARLLRQDSSKPMRVIRGWLLRIVAIIEFYYICIKEGQTSERLI